MHPFGYIQGRVARPILEPTLWRSENSLRTEDELGLRSLSETELNYSKCGSRPVVERARDGTPTLRSKAGISGQLNNLELGGHRKDHKTSISILFSFIHIGTVVAFLSKSKLHGTTHTTHQQRL